MSGDTLGQNLKLKKWFWKQGKTVISSRKSNFASVKTKATQDWHFCGWVVSQPHCKWEPKNKQGCLKIVLVHLPRCPSRAPPQEEPWTPLGRFQAPEVDLTSSLPHPDAKTIQEDVGGVLWGKPGKYKDGGPRLGRMEHTVWGSRIEDFWGLLG